MRKLYVLLGFLALIGCERHTDQLSADSVEWRLSTAWPAGFPGLGDAPIRLSKIVDKASNGQFKIVVYGAGEVVPAFDLFSAVSGGSVEMGHSSAYYWQDTIPSAPFFSAVPFGMNSSEMTSWLYYGGGLKLWRELYEPYDVIPFPGGNSGPQMGGWFNRPIESMEDWIGLKMRIPGFGAGVLKSVGAIPIHLPADALYNAFDDDVIDAVEWVGAYNDLAFGLYKLGRYYYYPAWHEPSTQMEFIINQAAYEALPSDLQQILVSAMNDINNEMQANFLIKNQQALDTLVKEHNVVLRVFPAEVMQMLEQRSEWLLLELGGHDPVFRKIHTSYSTYAAKLRRMRVFSLRL